VAFHQAGCEKKIMRHFSDGEIGLMNFENNDYVGNNVVPQTKFVNDCCSAYRSDYDSDDDHMQYPQQYPQQYSSPPSTEPSMMGMNNCELCCLVFIVIFLFLYWTLIFWQ